MTLKELLTGFTKNEIKFIYSEISFAEEEGFAIDIEVMVDLFRDGQLNYDSEVKYEYKITANDALQEIYMNAPDDGENYHEVLAKIKKLLEAEKNNEVIFSKQQRLAFEKQLVELTRNYFK